MLQNRSTTHKVLQILRRERILRGNRPREIPGEFLINTKRGIGGKIEFK